MSEYLKIVDSDIDIAESQLNLMRNIAMKFTPSESYIDANIMLEVAGTQF